jgi:mRNA interferase MazF
MKHGEHYIPKRGDIVWLEFNPRVGHEQSGIRPALVISPIEYNEKVGLAIFCPITSKAKGYPFEVKVNVRDKIKGVILSDQVKSLDWRKRNAKYITGLGKEKVKDVIEKISLLIVTGQL